MNDLNLQIVREFFELYLYRVLTHWQHDEIPKLSDFTSLLFIEHASPMGPREELGFVLQPEDMPHLGRAIVEVRAWHADRFYASVVEASPILGHVAFDVTRELGRSVLGTPEFATVLVISELPASPGPKNRSVALLREYGIDHILEFSTVLREMVNRVSPHGNYAPSQTLQTMRLLTRYSLLRQQQLEFAFPSQPPEPPASADIEATVPEDSPSDLDD